MRVIVTGSRNWVGQWGVDKIFQVLDATLELGRQVNQGFELIHGACPTGADDIANEWGIANGEEIMLTTWPAQWDIYGKAAGPVRNEQMMAAGGDLCVAFLRSNSSGTLDAIGKARRRGIWTVVIPWNDDNEVIQLKPRAVSGLVKVFGREGFSDMRVA
jgi:hypothetical protein